MHSIRNRISTNSKHNYGDNAALILSSEFCVRAETACVDRRNRTNPFKFVFIFNRTRQILSVKDLFHLPEITLTNTNEFLLLSSYQNDRAGCKCFVCSGTKDKKNERAIAGVCSGQTDSEMRPFLFTQKSFIVSVESSRMVSSCYAKNSGSDKIILFYSNKNKRLR